MLAENKVKCYKEIFAFVSKDKDITGLAAPEPRNNFDFIYHIKDVLFTYSLMSKIDLLKYSAEIKFEDNIDIVQLNKIADQLKADESNISSVSYDNYIKIQMAIPFNSMPEDNAVKFVYDKAVEFHNKFKEKVLNLEFSTKKVEYKGKVIEQDKEESYIGESKHSNKKSNVMEDYLDFIKYPHNTGDSQKGTLDNHTIPKLNKNKLNFDYNKDILTLTYLANNNITIDKTLEESDVVVEDNKCICKSNVNKQQDIEQAVSNMIAIINYINNNGVVETTIDETMKNTDANNSNENTLKDDTSTYKTTNTESSKANDNPSVQIKAKLFVKNKKRTDDKTVENKPKKIITTFVDQETEKKPVEEFEKNTYSNEKVQDEYMEMYKHMNEIYEERENVFFVKESNLKKRERALENEQKNIKEIRENLNNKWNEYNKKQKELNNALADYADKMTKLNEKEISIKKAENELDEKQKTYEIDSMTLQANTEKYELAKRNLLDEQSKMLETKNILDEREARLKLREADIEKQSQMNNLTEHQLSARENTLKAMNSANLQSEENNDCVSNSRLKELEKENKSLKAEIEALNDEINDMVDTCNEQLTEMETQANALIAEAKNTSSVDPFVVSEKEKQIKELKNKNKELQDMIDVAKETAVNTDTLKDRVTKLSNSNNELNNRNVELENSNKVLSEEKDKIQQELVEYKNKCEPDISAKTTKENLIAAGYNFDLIPTEGDIIVGCEINGISICINENAKMIYAEKPVKKGSKYMAKITEWNDESINAAYINLNNKIVCKKTFNNDTVVFDVKDIIEKFSVVK